MPSFRYVVIIYCQHCLTYRQISLLFITGIYIYIFAFCITLTGVKKNTQSTFNTELQRPKYLNIWSNLIWSYHILIYLILSCLSLSYLNLSFLYLIFFLSYLILSHLNTDVKFQRFDHWATETGSQAHAFTIMYLTYRKQEILRNWLLYIIINFKSHNVMNVVIKKLFYFILPDLIWSYCIVSHTIIAISHLIFSFVF